MINKLVDYGLRFSFFIAKILVRAGIRPITVTLFRFFIAAPVSLYFFSRGDYRSNVIGLILYMGFAILDWVDGDMAQLYKLPKQTAPLGRLVDHHLDRILMLIVLGGIFYAGMRGPDMHIWLPLSVLFYSSFFYLTVLLYEFDRIFGLTFDQYPELEKQMHRINAQPGFIDNALFNVLYVHKHTLYNFFFTISYILVIGIVIDQLLMAFILMTSMNIIRAAGLFFLTYKTLQPGPTGYTIVKVLRKYKPN